MKTIKFKDLELSVIDFQFADEDDGKKISFKTELTINEFEKIKEIKKNKTEYFVVDFEDKKINMRLGRPYWDLVGDKYISHIMLVEDIYDQKWEKDMGKTFDVAALEENLLIKNISVLRELINVLVAKNILTKNELNKLFEVAQKNEFDRRYETFQVKDLDKYEL